MPQQTYEVSIGGRDYKASKEVAYHVSELKREVAKAQAETSKMETKNEQLVRIISDLAEALTK